MHRSGTSLISQWLHRSGFHLGKDLLGPALGNAEGHFEDKDFLNFHEEVLLSRNLPDSGFIEDSNVVLSSAEKEKLKAIIANKNKIQNEWGWKEPRTCLFLPEYKALLPNAFYLVIVRDFSSTVCSLINRTFHRDRKKRMWIDQLFWNLVKGPLRRKEKYKEMADQFLKVWVAYNKAIAKHIETLPKNAYVVLDYNALLQNDQYIFSHLKQQWNFTLNYVNFKYVYKKELLKKAKKIDPYVTDKQLLQKAKDLEKQLRAYI